MESNTSGNEGGGTHPTLEAHVAERLRAEILSGERAPGTRLVETGIAEQYQVSRGPVRDALRKLEREGLVVLSPRRGAHVAGVTVEEGLELYEIRISLEGVAAQLAASRRDADDIASLKEVLAKGNAMVAGGRWETLAELNLEFHTAVAVASRNRELVSLLRHYGTRVAWMFSRSAEHRGAKAWEEHVSITEAIITGDSELAESLARRHIANSRADFVHFTAGRNLGAF